VRQVVLMAGIQLTTLGRTDLTGPGGRTILSVLSQPKRFALLVYLAVEGSKGLVRRDTIAALFWPDQDQRDARANLRKSIHFLRKSLGKKVLVGRGDEEVGIDPLLLQCDVVSLLDGMPTPARGPFLDGFHFSGASVEWEEWLAGVRERVRRSLEVLEGESESPPSGPETPLRTSHSPSDRPILDRLAPRQKVVLGTLFGVLVLTTILAWVFRAGRDAGASVRYDRIVLGSGVQFRGVVHRHYALPPDGSGILFRDTVDGKAGSWWKPGSQVMASYMPELDRAVSPAFSPDGRWIAFARQGHLLKQSPDGAVSLLLADSVSTDFSPAIDWLSSGEIYFEGLNHDLLRIPREGGRAELVATEEVVGRPFHVSGAPDGTGVLVAGCVRTCETAVPRLSFVDFERDTVVLLRAGVWMAWGMPDGYVVMVDGQGTVSAAHFEPEDGALGEPIPLLKGVRVSPFPEMAMGSDGSILYIPGGVEPNVRMPVWVDREGHAEPVDPDWPPLWDTRSLSLSPDGRRLAVGMRNNPNPLGEQIWIKELPGGPLAPLTVGPQEARRAAWTPDGRSLVVITQFQQADSTWASFVSTIPADASSLDPQPLLRPEGEILEVVFSSDGRTVAVRTGDAATGQGNIAFASLEGTPELKPFLESGAGEYSIDLSPDDRWLAYVSEVSGRPEVFVRPFPGPGPRVQVSMGGGVEPRWAHNGRELFYRSFPTPGPNREPPFMVTARVRTEPTFHVEGTERLFRDPYFRGNHIRLYDVTLDDARFIFVRPHIQALGEGPVVYSGGWYWTDEVQSLLGR